MKNFTGLHKVINRCFTEWIFKFWVPSMFFLSSRNKRTGCELSKELRGDKLIRPGNGRVLRPR